MKAKTYPRALSVVLVVFLYHVHFKALGERAILLYKDQASPSSWQWLTRFEFGSFSGWSQDGNSGGYTVCDISETATNDTNSWLVSDYVDLQSANEVHMGLTFTSRQCPAELTYCKQSFKVYVLHTHGPVPGGITTKEIKSGNFTLIDSVDATYLWTPGQTPQINQANTSFLANGSGAYFAFQDTGACLALTSVLVSYTYCPSIVHNGVVFKMVVAPPSDQQNITVNGNCSEKASPYPINSTLAMACLNSGQWATDVKVTCKCTAGYELVEDSCTECKAGYYKESVGNDQCISCPSNSVPSHTHVSCSCQSGFYRAPQDAISDGCTAPPSAPTNVNVTVATESVVVVTWSRPSYDGGRTDLSYDLQCSACSNIGFCSSNCSGVQFWPSAENLGTTQVTISNLNLAALYNITVISKNGVSEQAGASSVGYSHKTFSLTTPTTRIPESSTTLVAVTEPTTTGEIPSHENITTVGGETVPIQGTVSSKVATAIGISVAVTFVVCFLIGAVIIFLLIKFWRRKHFEQNSAQSSQTQLTELSRYETPSRRTRTVTATTMLTDDGSISPDIQNDHFRDNCIPTIHIDDVISKSRPNSAGSNHSLSISKNKITPALDWTPTRSISPVLLPKRLKSGFGTKRPLSPNSPRKPPEGSERTRIEGSSSVNSWFPAEEIQFNV